MFARLVIAGAACSEAASFEHGCSAPAAVDAAGDRPGTTKNAPISFRHWVDGHPEYSTHYSALLAV